MERNKRGCLFFDDMSAKPAYYAIQKILLEEAGNCAGIKK
jgi:hypothetical protein